MDLNKLIPNTNEMFKYHFKMIDKGHPVFEYADGVKTDKVIGTRYKCVYPPLDYEKFYVKVLGEKTPSIKYEGIPLNVKFTDLKGKAYIDFKNNNDIKISLTASSIIKVENKPQLKINKEVE